MAKRLYIFSLVVTTVFGLSVLFLSQAFDWEKIKKEGQPKRHKAPPVQAAVVNPSSLSAKPIQYSCSGHIPEIPNSCIKANPIAEQMLKTAEESEKGEPNWERVKDDLQKANAYRVNWLNPQEKILVQNSALRVALSASERINLKSITAPKEEILIEAMTLVFKVALKKELLQKMGSKPSEDLTQWIGEYSHSIDLPPNPHQKAFHGTRVFKAVQSRSRRAIYSQLVAVDTHGEAFLTPFIGDLKVRDEQSACAAVQRANYIYCRAPASLMPILDSKELTHNGMKDCRGCHQSWGAERPRRIKTTFVRAQREHLESFTGQITKLMQYRF